MMSLQTGLTAVRPHLSVPEMVPIAWSDLSLKMVYLGRGYAHQGMVSSQSYWKLSVLGMTANGAGDGFSHA